MIKKTGPSRLFGIEAMALIALIICASMLILGLRLNGYIRNVEIKSATASHAQFMSMLIEPLLNNAAPNMPLPEAVTAALDEVLATYGLTEEVETTVIWWPDGTIAYSSNPRLVGSKGESEHLDLAVAGHTVAFMEEEPIVHGLVPDQQEIRSVLELYVPLTVPGSDQVVAVGEFYQNPTRLQAQMKMVAQRIWAGLGITTLLMMGLLVLLVRRARNIVQMQQDKLSHQLTESQALASQNDALRQFAEQAKLDAVDVNESLLNRIGSDLHDGPLQLLGLAILHSDEPPVKADQTSKQKTQGMNAPSLTRQAMQELRQLADGLSLPETADLSLADTLRLAVQRHEKQTGTTVSLHLDTLPDDLPGPVKVSLYRVVQEGLNNAFRHAGGAGQQVSGSMENGEIEIRVSDDGPGMGATTTPMTGLGLPGIARRIQTLGGRLEVTSDKNKGTVVTARLPVG